MKCIIRELLLLFFSFFFLLTFTIHDVYQHKSIHIPDKMHIFLTSDSNDIRPIFVVLNSTLSNTLYPNRIVFHLLMNSTKKCNLLKTHTIKVLLKLKNEIICEQFLDNKSVEKLIHYRADSNARIELSSLYNFLPSYLSRIASLQNITRFLYLDTDVLVIGDIYDLFSIDFDGYPVGVVEDCSQKLYMYIDFSKIKNNYLLKDKGKECVFNRGVFIVNVLQWNKQKITEQIEYWMMKFKDSSKDSPPLYKYGMSQPPFMLSLIGNYIKLPYIWNVRGLGRSNFNSGEKDFFEREFKESFKKAHKTLKTKHIHYNRISPFIAPQTDFAKIIHFNGKYKPWLYNSNIINNNNNNNNIQKRRRLNNNIQYKGNYKTSSLCGEQMNNCALLWWKYLSTESNKDLMKI